ncbi:hypothetical protein ACQJBY_019340 [Aegilops geniculata]
MEGSFVSASTQSPAADDDNPSHYPSWIILDSRAHFADLDNATTIKAKASTGHEVKVTFCLAEPPAVSYFCVHCPEDCCATEPRVVSSSNELVLLCFAFRTGPRTTENDSHLLEYFVYTAASGGNQSIRPVPSSSPTYRHTWHAAIFPCEGDDFLIADLVRNADLVHYDLHVFWSDTSQWSTTHLKLESPSDAQPWDLPIQTDKVISLGGSMVGWVDLWRGIVICDVLDKEPVLRFLPLPRANFDLNRESEARPVRDVTGCHDGFINFVELEHCHKFVNVISRSNFNTPKIFDTQDTIYDTDIFNHDDDMGASDEDRPVCVPAGWKLRTMYRNISWDYWRKGNTIHVDDISACPTEPSMLLPRLWDDRDRKWTLRNLKRTGFPTFSICAGDVVYLMCKVESDDKDALLVGVDIGTKKLEIIRPYCGTRATSFDPTFISCAFSEHLNTTPYPRPCDEEVAVESAQNDVPNDHLSSGDTAPNNAQPQQNTCDGDVYCGTWNECGYGAHPGYDNYQQPIPQFLPPPNLTQTMQPMLSSTLSEGYIYARWTSPDAYGRMYISVPLNEMYKPFAIWRPPMLAQQPFAQPLAPGQSG